MRVVLLFVGTVAMYLLAPWMFYFWIALLPPIQKGYTLYFLLMGSSRWIATYSIVSTWILLERSIRNHSVRSRTTWLIIWLMSSLLTCHIGFLFLIGSNVEIWTTKDGWGAVHPYQGVHHFIEEAIVIPLRLILGFFSLSVDMDDRMHIYFVPPNFESVAVGLVEILTIPCCLLLGLLLSSTVNVVFRCTTKTSGLNVDVERGKDFRLLIRRAWTGYLCLITGLNWMVQRYLFLPINVSETIYLFVWLLLLVIESIIFSWVYFNLISVVTQRWRNS